MLDFGTVSPIGSELTVSDPVLSKSLHSMTARQEKLLGTLMSEIVRSTSQDKPLEIGAYQISGTGSRLYPHSHKSAFQDPNGTGAPLPTSPPIEHFGTIEPSPLGMPGVHAQMQMQNLHQNVQAPWLAGRSSQSPPSHSSASSFIA